MRALSLDAPGKIRMVSLSDPAVPGPAEALIRIRQVGVCGTDYHAFHGNQPFFTYPRILGHELGVEIVAVGTDVLHLAKGDHCAVRPYLSCGSCPACLRGKPNCCVYLQVLGSMLTGDCANLRCCPLPICILPGHSPLNSLPWSSHSPSVPMQSQGQRLQKRSEYSS